MIGSTTIKVTTLDSSLAESAIGDVDFVKIDTQGTELFILQGATDILRRSVFGVEVEVEFVDVYKEQPLFSDVDKFLRGLGFVLFDLNPFYWKRKVGRGTAGRQGQMIFADALCLKSVDEFLSHEACSKSKVLKAMTTCIVYGYFDYALAICEAGLERGILDRDEYDVASGRLKRPRHLSAVLPRFRGRNRVAQVFYVLYDILMVHDWALSGRGLGNAGKYLYRG